MPRAKKADGAQPQATDVVTEDIDTAPNVESGDAEGSVNTGENQTVTLDLTDAAPTDEVTAEFAELVVQPQAIRVGNSAYHVDSFRRVTVEDDGSVLVIYVNGDAEVIRDIPRLDEHNVLAFLTQYAAITGIDLRSDD